MSEREKTYVEDVNRSIYDIRNEEKDVYRIQKD
jgi:Fe-S cluster assembly protein SufB